MWARRCGAPERWPSRVKVIIFSIFDGTIGLSIYKYMAGSNISYLDLGKPASAEVQCLTNWPKSGHAISWKQPLTFFSWWTSAADLEDALANSQHCEGAPRRACERILAPIKDMKNPLALAMTGDDVTRMDILGMSARFFLVVTIFIWIGVVTHDLALVGRSNKDFILDVSGVNQHVPVIRRVWRCLAGYRPLFRILRYQGAAVRLLGMALAVFVVPGLIIWNLAVFNFVIVPLLLLAFFRYPIRMSRAWVFVVCLACSIYGLVLLTLQLAYLYLPEWRPRYAVTWKKAGTDCTCGCDYPISLGVNANLAVIGAATTMKSFFVAFRCLKGLRRSQWANLLSVVFPVPITVYAVDWRQNGQPVKGRTEKIAVQEEVAFDPFALMDEQLDSSSTTLHLRPEPINAYRSSDGKRLVPMRYARTVEMPAKPNLETAVQLTDMEYIGCCGFPWPTGGKKGVYSPEFIALVFEKTIEVQQPRAAGVPGMKLVPREATQPSSHEPAVEELEL